MNNEEINIIKLLLDGLLTEDVGRKLASVYIGFNKALKEGGFSDDRIDVLWVKIMENLSKKK